jgi:hypothetical protein
MGDHRKEKGLAGLPGSKVFRHHLLPYIKKKIPANKFPVIFFGTLQGGWQMEDLRKSTLLDYLTFLPTFLRMGLLPKSGYWGDSVMVRLA